MGLIRLDDWVHIFAKKNKLNINELITGKRYYICELTYEDKVLVSYHDIREPVNNKEDILNKYSSEISVLTAIFL